MPRLISNPLIQWIMDLITILEKTTSSGKLMKLIFFTIYWNCSCALTLREKHLILVLYSFLFFFFRPGRVRASAEISRASSTTKSGMYFNRKIWFCMSPVILTWKTKMADRMFWTICTQIRSSRKEYFATVNVHGRSVVHSVLKQFLKCFCLLSNLNILA